VHQLDDVSYQYLFKRCESFSEAFLQSQELNNTPFVKNIVKYYFFKLLLLNKIPRSEQYAEFDKADNICILTTLNYSYRR